jgi:hypothetical protein
MDDHLGVNDIPDAKSLENNDRSTALPVNAAGTSARICAETVPPGTVAHLIASYRADRISGYQKIRHQTRQNYDRLLRRLEREHGATRLADIRLRHVLAMHADWSEGGKLAMGHQMVGMLRTLFGFGTKLLEDPECARLAITLNKERFPQGAPRDAALTAEQVRAIIEHAHFVGSHSIALAQAFQFECMLRQKDVVGEYVPRDPLVAAEIEYRGMAWGRGLRWEEISPDLILTHVTSKRQKEIAIDLRGAPLVMAELARLGDRPTSGPVVRFEVTGRPYFAHQFRREWRLIATAVGVPLDVRNMDSRAGAITEATMAGAQLEHVRHAATHSDISMTQRYARGAADKIAAVQQARVAHRTKEAES